ncbi:MAG: DUF308 domain-containing protein [Brooklawnia sp.]|uniref:HdeD family acid-resistance protein n=1 Tax=Brooklawnia sp. TaxID=2699740 RepID=UPI003C730CF9
MSATATEEQVALERRRTVWDVIFGILMVIAGVFLLGNVVLATAVSVLVFGWTTLISGIIMLIAALARIRQGGWLAAALGGAVLIVVGLFILRNPVIGAVALTMVAGSLFLVSGIVRIFAAFEVPAGKVILIISGLISVGLGIWVLLNIVPATLSVLGIILGVQVLLEGLTLIAVGRLRAPKKS